MAEKWASSGGHLGLDDFLVLGEMCVGVEVEMAGLPRLEIGNVNVAPIWSVEGNGVEGSRAH